jgi:DNA invertase Pin-like site-specific DNA recombinase
LAKAREVPEGYKEACPPNANSGSSTLVFTILFAVAEAERDRTRQRIREVKRDQYRLDGGWEQTKS